MAIGFGHCTLEAGYVTEYDFDTHLRHSRSVSCDRQSFLVPSSATECSTYVAPALVVDGIRRAPNASTCVEANFFLKGIGDVGLSRLALAIQDHAHLVSLDLGQNSISDQGVKDLAEALSWEVCKCSLRALSLRRNKLTVDSLPHLISWLALPSTALEFLSLGFNNIFGDSAAHRDNRSQDLLYQLLTCRSLKSVSLRHTGLCDTFAKPVERSLKQSTSLVELNMQDNRFTSDGVIAIAAGVEANASLQQLALAGNPIDNCGSLRLNKCIVERAKQSRPLKCVWMGETMADPADFNNVMLDDQYSFGSPGEALQHVEALNTERALHEIPISSV